MSKIKVLMVGPQEAGKTVLSNILADIAEGPSDVYRPTKAWRIVEFEKDVPLAVKKQFAGNIFVELWDCSGDIKYKNCWPAIHKGAQGIIFVYNPKDPDAESNMEFFINEFAKKASVLPKQCMAYANHHDIAEYGASSKPLRCFKGLTVTDCTADNSTSIVTAFDMYFKHLMGILSQNQENEENKIMEDA